MVELSLGSQKASGNEKNIPKNRENVPHVANPSVLEIDDIIFESDDRLLEACEVAINRLNETEVSIEEGRCNFSLCSMLPFVVLEILDFLDNFEANSTIETSTTNNSGKINDSTKDSYKVQNGIVENQSECLSTSEGM